jgi:hypothetical protein
MEGDLECQGVAREIVYKFSSRFINNMRFRGRVLKLIRHRCL